MVGVGRHGEASIYISVSLYIIASSNMTDRFLKTIIVIAMFIIVSVVYYFLLPLVIAMITFVLAVGYIVFAVVGIFHLLKK